MPIYEYQCQKCEKIVEIWQSLSDEPLTKCQDCKGKLKKLISRSSFQLKGGGWYSDGYSNSAKATPPPAQCSESKEVKKEAPASCPKKGNTACADCK